MSPVPAERARVVAPPVLPMVTVSALVLLVAMLTVVAPFVSTPPMSMVPVIAASARLRVVAAPPILRVVTVELKREAVVVDDVISALVAPLTARSPVTVTSPSEVSSAMEKRVLVPSVTVRVPVFPRVRVGEVLKAMSAPVPEFVRLSKAPEAEV